MKKLLILLLLVFSMTMAVTGCLSVTVPTSYSGADSSVSSVITSDSSSVKPSSSNIKPSSSSVKPSSSSIKPSSSSVKPSSSSAKPSSSSTKPSSSSVVAKFLITFKNGQETLQETSFVKGEKIVYTGETPAKASTVEYTYTFKGWSLTENGSVVDLTTQTVSKATTYYAVFTQAVRKYTITWNVEGTKTTTSVEYGKAPTTTLKPTKTATAEYTYTFAGWSLTSGGNVVDLTTQTVSKATTYYAVFTQAVRKYTVTWNVEGTKTTTSVEYGKEPTTTLKPTKTATAEYTYTFAGWSTTSGGNVVDLTTQTIKANTTYYAVFTQTTRKYTVTWDVNGKKTTTSVQYGKAPTTTLKPTKASTAQYTYTFKGWSTTENGNVVDLTTQTIKSNITYYAVFNSTIRTYTVRFSVDGIVVQNETLEYGTTIKYNFGTPYLQGHEFLGWTKTNSTMGEIVSSFGTVEKNTSFYALFTDLSVWDGTIPTLASGATVDTLFKKDNSGNYLIENATDLSELSALSNGKNFGSGLKFKLLMNIDLSANNWLPICDDNTVKGNWNASYYAFCGTFDGDNKTITFNENYTKEGLQLGLFRALGSGANISNIIFNGKATVGGYYGPVAGAIIGDNVKISNVTNNVNITSIMTPSTTPTALDKYANVILGGVVGLVEESVGQNIVFENCKNNGTITGVNQSRNLGGIVANVKRGNTVNFINCSNTASITGGAYIGGLAGSVELWGTGVSTKAYITNCSKMATITGYTLSGVSKIATESYGVAEPYVGNLIGYHSTSIITSVWDGTIPTLASGATVDTLFTKDSSGYYLIQSAQDLATLSALSNGKDFGSGLKFKQTINIDLSANNWLPICDDNTVKGNWKASYYAFCGTYDGNNKTITFNENYSKDGLQLGLFRALGSDANISNIIFNGKATVGGYYGPVAGIIVGDNVKISNVTNNVNITSIMKPSTTPTALDKYANVILGGVVGLVEESVGQNIIFENCRNNGTITGVNQSRNLGGIVANVKRGNTVNFINCSNTASITGGAYAGGIVGIVEQWGTGYTTRIEMTGCTNTATITGYDLDGTKKTATIEIGSASPYLGLLIGVNHATGTTSVWDGTYPTLASGATVDTLFTKDSSGNYLIQSAQDLATLSVLSRGVDFGSGLKFKVTSDIDMSAGEWVPICNRGTASTPNYSSWTWKYFLGSFDGDGHTITIKMDITSDTEGMAGALFEGIKGSVSNLVIKGSIKVKTRAGALCYMASGATISNITSYMTITATASGTVYLGGMVGAIDKVDSVTTITNCKNYSVVFADALGNNVGGIVGSVGKGFKIVNCVNKGNITGGANVGGIIGYVANTITSFEVTSCTNSGVVKAGNIVSDIDYGTNANGRGGLLVGNYGCKKFTIKFSVNGTITSVNVVAGNVPTFDGTPTKEKDSNYTYTFAGWAISVDGSVIELPVALEDATYYAIFACDTIEEIEYIDLHSSSLTTQQKEQINALFYKNVVTSKSDQTGELTNPCTADPSVVYCKEDGYYYMYGTYDTTQGTDKWRISCFRSSDFIKWEQLDYAFYGPTSSTSTYESVVKDSGVMTEAEFNNYKSTTWIKYGNLWAPSVFYDETTKQYIMYSSGQTREDGGYALFIATSKNPAGPFIQWKGTIKGGTYQDGTAFATKTIDYATKIFDFRGAKDNFGRIYDDIDAIDAEPFIDPKTGDKYLFFVSARNGTTRPTNDIFGIKMIDWFTPDMSTLTLLAKPNYKKVTDTTPIFNDEGEINEGPCVLYNEKNGYYYLTFTVNGYIDKEYCVKQAIATSPLGVYDKITNDKGGRIISCQNNWTHRAGTGHHTFITVGNELFIVCPMHKVTTYTGSKWRSRVITIERTVWLTNSDGLLVLNSSGPTMDYTLRPDVYTGYTNLVSKATIGYNQAEYGANTVYLADGTVKVINKGDIAEFNAKKEQLILSLGFDECITLKGLMITNSADKYKAFDKISKIEIEYFKNGVICKAVIGEVLFDFENNLVLDDYLQSYLVPGCNSTAIFNEIQNVCNIKIYIEPQVGDNITGLSVAEIAVIGK